MSYTIVYARQFLKCRDRFIPIALYGDNNVESVNPITQRYQRDRKWSTFSVNDDMILGTADDIMAIANKTYSGTNPTCFKFQSRWLDERKVPGFFQRGIDQALTIEELNARGACVAVHVYLSVWGEKHGYGDREKIEYLRNSVDIYNWILEAKARKRELIASGEARQVFICIGFDTTQPLQMINAHNVAGRVAAKCKYGYVTNVDCHGMSFSKDSSKAKIFDSEEDAIAALPKNHGIKINIVSAAKVSAKSKSQYVLTVGIKQLGFQEERVCIVKRTRAKVSYSSSNKYGKTFPTEKAALKWYDQYIDGKFSGFGNPKAVLLATD